MISGTGFGGDNVRKVPVSERISPDHTNGTKPIRYE